MPPVSPSHILILTTGVTISQHIHSSIEYKIIDSMLPPAKIILGSSSPTRQAILKEMGFAFTIMTADIDEKAIRREKPEDLVMALAEAKAEAIKVKLEKLDLDQNDLEKEPVLLITSDQVVVHEGNIREKPSDENEARRFIKSYSKAPASTVGAVLVTNLTTAKKSIGVDRTEIYFHPIPDEVIESLLDEGSVLYVAGGLMIEHPLVSPLVSAMVGSLDSVMGLPKELTLSLISDALQT